MYKIKTIFAVLIFSLFSLNLFAASMECTVPTKDEVAGLFDRWNASLATLKSDEVIKNYAENSVLLPTLQNALLADNKGKKKYFDSFLKNKPVGKMVQREIFTGCNYAVDTGMYNFTLTDAKGKTSVAEARYTYVYELQNGKWLIVNHISSLVPNDHNH